MELISVPDRFWNCSSRSSRKWNYFFSSIQKLAGTVEHFFPELELFLPMSSCHRDNHNSTLFPPNVGIMAILLRESHLGIFPQECFHYLPRLAIFYSMAVQWSPQTSGSLVFSTFIGRKTRIPRDEMTIMPHSLHNQFK